MGIITSLYGDYNIFINPGYLTDIKHIYGYLSKIVAYGLVVAKLHLDLRKL